MKNALQKQEVQLPELKPLGFFRALMSNADTVQDVCLDYFAVARVPNIAGLCANLGTTPTQLKSLFRKVEETPEDPDLPTEGAMAMLASAIMHIEATIVEGGLGGRFNAHMSKFILSAFHNRNEKVVSESNNTNQVTVRVESVSPISIEELRELERLETAMDEQSKGELIAMGRATERKAIIDESMLTV